MAAEQPVDDQLRRRWTPTARAGYSAWCPAAPAPPSNAWLTQRDQAWRDGIEVVALDPSAPFAAAIRRVLPQATIVVDHWHLVRLANQAVTEVRQRVARQQLGRRGRKADPAWAHRRLLLAAGDRLSAHGLARLRRVLAADDPTNEIAAAWAVKELLRQLLATTDPDQVRHRLWRFYDAAARGRPAGDHPAGADHRDVVAGDRGLPAAARHQRPHRGHQPGDQADQAGRLRLPQPGQLPAPYRPARRRPERGVTKISREHLTLKREEPLYGGAPFHQRAIMLLGDGKNGKGTFLKWLRALLGDRNVSNVKPQALDADRFATAQLYGKLANVAGDVSATASLRTPRGSRRSPPATTSRASAKYGQPFSFIPVATVIASFNEMPVTAGPALKASSGVGSCCRFLITSPTTPPRVRDTSACANAQASLAVHAPAEPGGGCFHRRSTACSSSTNQATWSRFPGRPQGHGRLSASTVTRSSRSSAKRTLPRLTRSCLVRPCAQPTSSTARRPG